MADNVHRGTTLDSLLEQEGTLGEFQARSGPRSITQSAVLITSASLCSIQQSPGLLPLRGPPACRHSAAASTAGVRSGLRYWPV